MQNRRPSVLFVGAIDFHEFGAAVRWLRAHTQLEVVPTVAAAIQRCASQQAFWHTVVIAQARPGEFGQGDLDQLSHALPLTHLIALLGSCCEGESRSGRPWPGVVRVYWHQFAARAASELRLDAVATSWQLQRTASDAERTDHALQHLPRRADGRIAIWTSQAVFYDALASVCRIAGYQPLWTTAEQESGVDGAVAVLWHGPLLTSSDLRPLQHVVSRSQPARVIALLDFPRYDDVQRATDAGAAAVLPLPFLLADLWNTLQEVAS